VGKLREAYEVVQEKSALRALARLTRETFAGVYVFSDHLSGAVRLGRLLQNERILEGMPDGVVLIDSENTIMWANSRLRQWSRHKGIEGANFYTLFGNPEILGPDFAPFHTALATGQASNSTLRSDDNCYFQVHAAPLFEAHGPPDHLIVTVRDVTQEVMQQQKLAAIHKAGIELADLTPEEVFNMEVEDRIELLKSNILHYTKDLLNFDVVEIRLLDQRTSQLMPLLSEGLEPSAAVRILYAKPHGNGVTGFVAATGKSYLCEDTTEDPLYIEGAKGAKSSLTVPLILHDQVIGTFNVESPDPRAFSESDLQFLEIFSRDVAAALNTLELLVAQQANTAQASVEAIHREVALPVDEILNDAVNVMERYIGHEPDVAQRLQRILRNARDIKQVIHKVGQKMTPAEAVVPDSAEVSAWPKLRDRRVLVADADEAVRSAAHSLLERYGCVVETAHEGHEAIFMVRNSGPDAAYDVIIADIRMPDMTGYELLVKLQEIMAHVPLVLMSGFGYDPHHSIVKARQAGLLPSAVLYKPFRLDQLLETVDRVIEISGKVPSA
jgi:CheY-like chemotaxis protein